ncbi:MAG: hypothetical protein U5K37_05830 [Natrialbaceae archaeon]|nr:hypothetical protein [Natrialbaceae archaeon]
MDAAHEDVTEGTIDESGVVSYHTPRPGRLVLTERQNCDGWIASDLVVDLEP